MNEDNIYFLLDHIFIILLYFFSLPRLGFFFRKFIIQLSLFYVLNFHLLQFSKSENIAMRYKYTGQNQIKKKLFNSPDTRAAKDSRIHSKFVFFAHCVQKFLKSGGKSFSTITREREIVSQKIRSGYISYTKIRFWAPPASSELPFQKCRKYIELNDFIDIFIYYH